MEVTCRHDFFAWERPCSGTAGADGIPAMLPSLGRIAEDGSGMKLGLQGLALDHPHHDCSLHHPRLQEPPKWPRRLSGLRQFGQQILCHDIAANALLPIPIGDGEDISTAGFVLESDVGDGPHGQALRSPVPDVTVPSLSNQVPASDTRSPYAMMAL